MLTAGFWSETERELARLILPSILRAVAQGSITGGEMLEVAGVSVDWSLVNAAVTRAANEFASTTAAQVTQTNLKAYTVAFEDWVQSGEPLEELIGALEVHYGAVKANQIAVTETTRAFATGNITVWRDAGLKEQRFRTANDDDVCLICDPLEDQIFALDDTEATPPLHVNCRCFLIPVVDLDE